MQIKDPVRWIEQNVRERYHRPIPFWDLTEEEIDCHAERLRRHKMRIGKADTGHTHERGNTADSDLHSGAVLSGHK